MALLSNDQGYNVMMASERMLARCHGVKYEDTAKTLHYMNRTKEHSRLRLRGFAKRSGGRERHIRTTTTFRQSGESVKDCS